MEQFLTPSSFWVPEYQARTAWADHTPFAFWLIDVLRPARLVELGTHYGYSYFSFNQALRKLEVKCHCSAVDTWTGDRQSGSYGDEVYKAVDAYNRSKYEDFSDLLKLTFDEALDRFEDGSIDLLHIDGRHFYEDVKHDFASWLPKLTRRAVVLLHDTNVCVNDFGVFRVWDELKSKYPHFEFLTGHGLGVLGVGSDVAETGLAGLFAASADAAKTEFIRSAYGRLGSAVAEQNSYSQLENRHRDLIGLYDELNARHQTLDGMYHAVQDERARVEDGWRKTSASLAKAEAELKEVATRLSQEREALRPAEEDLARVRQTLRTVQDERAQLASDNAELRAKQDLLQHRVSTLDGAWQSFKLNRQQQHESENGDHRTALLPKASLGLVRNRLSTSAVVGVISGSGLFDREYYARHNPDVVGSKVNLIEHYVRRGAYQGRDPHPLFRSKWYLQQNPNVATEGTNPLYHYLKDGFRKHLDPHPLFETEHYRGQVGSTLPEDQPALLHFLSSPTPADPHPLFNSSYYQSHAGAAGANPLLHYVEDGWKRKLDPHPLFQIAYYAPASEPSLEIEGEPLEHYLRRGAYAGKNPHPLFDSDWYLAHNPDVAAARINPLAHYLCSGYREGRDPCPYFDSAYYLQHNPDVRLNDLNPLLHYLASGAAEGRDPSPRFRTKWYVRNYMTLGDDTNPLIHYVHTGKRTGAQSAPSEPNIMGRKRIVFVSGEASTPGHQYRVSNLASALPSCYFDVVVIKNSELPGKIHETAEADVVWIWRATYSELIQQVIENARDAKAKLIFDIDDLMFRPEMAKTSVIDGIRTQGLSEPEVEAFFSRVREVLLQADHCTTPTSTLAREISADSKPVTVIPNGFDSATLLKFRRAYREREKLKTSGDPIRIGYAAGSMTHQRDLAVAADSLARVLSENPQTRLVLFRNAIELSEFPQLQPLLSQIEWRDKVPVSELASEYARFDINIAPLEVGNPFCEAKSELKFFEAALAMAPTIASPTAPYAAAIRSGENGFLALSSDDWYQHLSTLVADPTLCKNLAQKAYTDCLWFYGPERRSQLVQQVVYSLTSVPSLRSAVFALGTTSASEKWPPAAVPASEILYESIRADASRVSVVIPLFNYEQLIVEALDSVKAQTYKGIDLIVVDDCSIDSSAAVAENWLRENFVHFNYVALLRNKVNSKLGRSRNAVVAFSDSELFLPLDPDNRLLPRCVEACIEILDSTGAAFAYPTTEVFGDDTGLLGLVEFDPAILRAGNYIDAMAMVRKACWIRVGGYSPLEPVGWEDYDFWCKLVELGFYGARVSEVIAQYRVHDKSMLRTITELPANKPLVLRDLKARHPWLALEVPTASPTGRGAKPEKSTADQFAPRSNLHRLLPILECPKTKEDLVELNADTLASSVTGQQWPVVLGRPVFTGQGAHVSVHPETHLSNVLPQEAIKLIQECGFGLVLNLSAGGSADCPPNVVELEYAIFRNTTLVGDVHELPFKASVFDAVICMNAFEHYREPDAAMNEILRILKPGGRLLMRTAFLQPQHEAPYHFYNCTEFGLRHWLRDFEVKDIRVSANFNPIYALSWLCSELENGFRSGVSQESADEFSRLTLGESLQYWRNPEIRETVTWQKFFQLPLSVQHQCAAGWQALAEKKREPVELLDNHH